MRSKPNAQRVAMYLMTAPGSEMTGVFYCPLSYILNDVGSMEPEAPSEGLTGNDRRITSPFEGVAQALVYLNKVGFCFYDFETEWVFVTEMARWQIGEKLRGSDKRISGLRKSVNTMPESMKSRFLARYNEDFSLGFKLEKHQTNDEKVISPFEGASRSEQNNKKPHRSQEQEQEQEQEQDQEQKKETSKEKEAASPPSASLSVLDSSLKAQMESVGDELIQKSLDDPDHVLNPVEMVALARLYAIKLSATHDLREICDRKTITVDCFRRCVEIWKMQAKPTGYLIGILRNAALDPQRYQTSQYQSAEAARKRQVIDQWGESEVPL